MNRLTPDQCKQYNYSQTAVGAPLMTLKGSKVHRSKFEVGKPIGGCIYLHRSYITVCDDIKSAYEANVEKVPFDFTLLRYNPKTDELAFIECPDFDIDREPRVGRIFIAWKDGTSSLSRSYQQIYHHKWTMVKNDYTGFNVKEAWEWSRKWLSMLTRPADGSCLANWKVQLAKCGLA